MKTLVRNTILIICLVVAGVVTFGIHTTLASSPHWSCSNDPWVIGDRGSGWWGTTQSIGQSLPGEALATVAIDQDAHLIRLWLYDGVQQDKYRVIPYSDLRVEYPTELDIQHLRLASPYSLVYNGNQLKIIGRTEEGEIFRIYTHCSIVQ